MLTRRKTIMLLILICLLTCDFTYAAESKAPDYSKQIVKADTLLKSGHNQKAAELFYNISHKLESTDKDKSKDLFNKAVEIDMQNKQVDDILKPCFDKGLIKRVNDSNYDAEVLQTSTPKGKRMPALVLFYINIDKTNHLENFSGRNAIILKSLVHKYSDKVTFFFYNSEIILDFSKIRKYKIKSIPSIAMYSPFDLVKGETPENNDGEIKQVDIVRGAPDHNKYIYPQYIMLDYWISHLALNLEDKTEVYKFSNQYKIRKVK
jgi:hypothetical protein